MVYQPPAGARDLLPLGVAQKRWIEDKLQQVFHRWGYHRIITSTLERMDTLMAGGAIQDSTVIQLQNANDEELGLRPELTASIARTVVTRMAGNSYPQRLYYNDRVFQRPPNIQHNQPQEFFQAGVELLGGGGLIADAEVLMIVANCLQGLAIKSWHLILGDAGITRSLLKIFPQQVRPQVRQAIANLDRVAIDKLSLSEELKTHAKTILDLRGKPHDTLKKVYKFDLGKPQKEAVNNLKTLVDLIESQVDFSLILDLSLIQTIDYYTGIVFEVVSNAETGVTILGRGGRYDQLLGLYDPQGESVPGIGFAFSIEGLYQILLQNQQLPVAIPTTNWLVVPETPNDYGLAFAHAQKLRDSQHLVRVEVDLVSKTAAEVKQYAIDRGILHIAWITAGSLPVIELVHNQEKSQKFDYLLNKPSI
ncbi:ATP phosphoribosyltransferase regulatory subunit [Richelia intracellularis HM01]|uniref:ATP phosphoribosyltransferase regulatory subunit n=1 Tax=Richelia intracellularis TaxID=1164990 RepID=UPI0002B5B75D|nr:ATP phosphoribosyltransferase regulatory subunit [Richelia intracellularis]CCH66154.1 ATP phosphoribosyltransferase regulatory subunit [Richelia intracellularis HM01]